MLAAYPLSVPPTPFKRKISTEAASAATILTEPDFMGIEDPGLRRFREGRRSIERGEAAAEAALPRIAAILPWVSQ